MATAVLKSRSRASDLVLRGSSLSYLGIMVALPIAALTVEALRPGAAHSGRPFATLTHGTLSS